jgi:hypothetical protein
LLKKQKNFRNKNKKKKVKKILKNHAFWAKLESKRSGFMFELLKEIRFY